MSRQNKLRNKRAYRESQIYTRDEKGVRVGRRKGGPTSPFNKGR